jgi:hypothetical protein
VTGGSKLKIVVNETVFHPGHFRISLSRKRNTLPLDPSVSMHETERGLRSQSAFIMTTPMPPIIVDGLWPHTEKPAANWETEITLPNITCEGCQLQVIQVMIAMERPPCGGLSGGRPSRLIGQLPVTATSHHGRGRDRGPGHRLES